MLGCRSDIRLVRVPMEPKVAISWQDTWNDYITLGGWPILTGLFALQFAIHLGAKTIWLIGYDSSPSRVGQHKYYNYVAKQLTTPVYNTNPDSLIRAFPTLERKDFYIG